MARGRAPKTDGKDNVTLYFPLPRMEYYRLFDHAKEAGENKKELALSILTSYLDRHVDDEVVQQASGPEKAMTVTLDTAIYERLRAHIDATGLTKKLVFTRALDEYWAEASAE